MILTFTLEGLPSTDHRPRVGKTWRGKTSLRRSPEYDAWKTRLRMAALAARPPGWRLDLRYAVECVGYMPSNAYDADNLRCLGDAAQGVLWVSDTRVRPITYDYQVDKLRPRLEVEIVAYDPKRQRVRRWLEVEEIGAKRPYISCAADGGIVAPGVDAPARAAGGKRPRGVGAPGVETEPRRLAR